MTSTASLPLLACTAFLSAALGATWTSHASAPQDVDTHDVLRTRRLELVDEAGNLCGGFDVGSGSARHVQLWLARGEDPKSSLRLWVDELEGVSGARIHLRSSGGPTWGSGITSLSSSSGRGSVTQTRSRDGEAPESLELAFPIEPTGPFLEYRRGERTESWP